MHLNSSKKAGEKPAFLLLFKAKTGMAGDRIPGAERLNHAHWTLECILDKRVIKSRAPLGWLPGIYWLYQRDLRKIRARLAAGSQLVQTASGPVEYATWGAGARQNSWRSRSPDGGENMILASLARLSPFDLN